MAPFLMKLTPTHGKYAGKLVLLNRHVHICSLGPRWAGGTEAAGLSLERPRAQEHPWAGCGQDCGDACD